MIVASVQRWELQVVMQLDGGLKLRQEGSLVIGRTAASTLAVQLRTCREGINRNNQLRSRSGQCSSQPSDLASMRKGGAPQDEQATNPPKRSQKTTALDQWLSSGPKSTPAPEPIKHPRTSRPSREEKDPLDNGEGLHSTEDEAEYPPNPTASSQNPTKVATRLRTLTITEEKGDIFASPKGSVLIHACNCEGLWSAGIALAFKKHYPKAYDVYHQHCKKYKHDQGSLRGTALLIPPVDGDAERRHSIGCLFTSFHVGWRKDSEKQILENTKLAMEDLLRQVEVLMRDHKLVKLRMCQINAGSFKVPWRTTVDILEAMEITEDMPQSVTVVTR